MDIVTTLLSGPAMLAVAGIAALAIVVRALTGFLGEAADLRVRLQSVDQELGRLRNGLPEMRERVEVLRREVMPYRQMEQRMRAYYAKVSDLHRKAQRKAEEESADGRGKDDIQVHRPGPSGL